MLGRLRRHSRESASKVVESVIAEFRNLKSAPVPEEELRRAKDQLKGSLMLSLESSTARMSNLARQEMYFDRFYGLDELIERIEAVTPKTCSRPPMNSSAPTRSPSQCSAI